ncbi:MAG TPA: choice-of-anchor D domain-containing protein [Archangium sp.]|nr:choice-of-anchor D domain-containing protein [Archangium sp.]
MWGMRWMCVAACLMTLVGAGCDRPSSHRAPSGLGASPEKLEFGLSAVGVTKTMKVRLSNRGRAPFMVHGARATLPNVEVTPFDAFELKAGGEREVEVRFTADVEGAVAGQLEVLTDADNVGREGVAKLGLDGQGVKAFVDVPGRTLDFGNVELGQVEMRELVVRNPTKVETPVRVSFDGSDADQFSSSETGRSFQLKPGEERRVPLSFNPERLGAASAQLHVGVECPMCEPIVVALSGTGIATLLEVTPLRVDFGRVPVGATAEERVIVRNLGT